MALRRPRDGRGPSPTTYHPLLPSWTRAKIRCKGCQAYEFKSWRPLALLQTPYSIGRPNIASPGNKETDWQCPLPISTLTHMMPAAAALLFFFFFFSCFHPSISRHIAFASTCHNKCFWRDEFSQPLNPWACKMSILGPLQVYRFTCFWLACFRFELTMLEVTLRMSTTCFECILWINCVPWCYWRFEFKYIV